MHRMNEREFAMVITMTKENMFTVNIIKLKLKLNWSEQLEQNQYFMTYMWNNDHG